MSSLSHSITVRSGMAAFSIGTSSLSAPLRDHEPADVLGEVARKAADLVRERAPSSCTVVCSPGIQADSAPESLLLGRRGLVHGATP